MGVEESCPDHSEFISTVCDEYNAEYDVVDLLVKRFYFITREHEGRLDQDTFMREAGFDESRPEKRKLVERLFPVLCSVLGEDGEDYLTVESFIKAVFVLAGQEDKPILKAKIIFRLLDTDKKGAIGRPELTALAKALLGDTVDEDIWREAIRATLESIHEDEITEKVFIEQAQVNPWWVSIIAIDYKRMTDRFAAE